jgi:hypothetical protein
MYKIPLLCLFYLAITVDVEVNGVHISLPEVSGEVPMSFCVHNIREKYPNETMALIEAEIMQAMTFQDTVTTLPEDAVIYTDQKAASAVMNDEDAALGLRSSLWQTVNVFSHASDVVTPRIPVATTGTNPYYNAGISPSFEKYGSVIESIIQGTRLYEKHGNGVFLEVRECVCHRISCE